MRFSTPTRRFSGALASGVCTAPSSGGAIERGFAPARFSRPHTLGGVLGVCSSRTLAHVPAGMWAACGTGRSTALHPAWYGQVRARRQNGRACFWPWGLVPGALSDPTGRTLRSFLFRVRGGAYSTLRMRPDARPKSDRRIPAALREDASTASLADPGGEARTALLRAPCLPGPLPDVAGGGVGQSAHFDHVQVAHDPQGSGWVATQRSGHAR